MFHSANSRYLIAAGDISHRPVFAKRFRGKTMKEIYRCTKGIAITRSIVKPVGYALATVPAEFSKGFIYTAIGDAGEAAIGYISGVGFVRYLYKVVEPSQLKASARLVYNIACLPITVYSKGVGSIFDLFQLSKIEKWWFGEPVYIFDDNRLWVEKNFTLGNLF